MGDKSSIEWTDATFNPWIGCTKVSPGCDRCYAERESERRGWAKWGVGEPRHRTSEAYWRAPLKWDRKAKATGKRTRVFCASLADVFDNEVPNKWRADLWGVIAATPNLDWLLLTKRIGNVAKMLPDSWGLGSWPNIWLGISIVNQEEADRDIPKLLATPAAVRFVSYEPALAPFDLSRWIHEIPADNDGDRTGHDGGLISRIDWIIIGGESGPGARLFDIAWARSVIAQRKAAGVSCFMKQLGSRAGTLLRAYDGTWESFPTKDRKGGDPAEWPADLRVREFPR